MLTAAALSLGVGLAAACTEDPTAPSPTMSAAVTSTGSLGFLTCVPQPYAASSALIGPGGGVVSVGRHKLIIPQGALSKRVLITMEAPSETVNSVRFGPEGLTFNTGALPRLRLDYSNCPGAKYLTKKIVYTSESLSVLEEMPTRDDAANNDVMTLLRHFSRYAIDY
jgi:hypothetical protein